MESFAVNCVICKNILQGPMIMPCGHTFCSYCIRSQNTQQKGSLTCPSCSLPCKAGLAGLIKNNLVEDLICKMLEMDQELASLKAVMTSPAANNTSTIATQTTTDLYHTDIDQDHALDHTTMNDQYQAETHHHHNNQSSSSRPVRKKIKVTGAESSRIATQSNPKDAIVQCPLCNANVKAKHINSHMDKEPKCQTLIVNPPPPPRPNIIQDQDSDDHDDEEMDDEKDGDFIQELAPTTSKSSKPSNRRARGSSRLNQYIGESSEIVVLGEEEMVDTRKHLSSLVYDQLKDKDIRAVCDAAGISSSGDRTTLKKRHTHWTLLYNANLDCKPSLRKSDRELRRELVEWDKSRAASRVHMNGIDVARHLQDYAEEFRDLIEKARPKKKRGDENMEILISDDANHEQENWF